MRVNKIAVLVSILLIGVIGTNVYLYTQTGKAEPVGVWKEVDGDYYISFLGDGEYVDSIYGVRRDITVDGDDLIFRDAAGETVRVTPRKNLKREVMVSINGESHLMAPYEGGAQPVNWAQVESLNCVGAYKQKTDSGSPLAVRIYDNAVCVLSASGEIERARYAKDSSGNLYIFRRDNDFVEVMKPWAMGYVCGEMSGQVSGTLVSGGAIRDRGYNLFGTAKYERLGVAYRFLSDTRVERETQDGTIIEFLYYADSNGLVTMTDMSGLGVRDYLYYDEGSMEMYRYVLQDDDWYDYLQGMGG